MVDIAPADMEALAALKTAWCDSFDLIPVDINLWTVSTPLLYDDGDGLPLFVSYADNAGWQLQDCGMTFSHLFFDGYESTEARLKGLQRTVTGAGFNIDDEHRISLDLAGPPDVHDLGDFLQIVAQVQGVAAALQTDHDRTRYVTAIRTTVVNRVNTTVVENWAPDEIHAKGSYRADLKLDRPDAGPLALFLASTSERTKTAAITVEQFHRHSVAAQPLLAYRPDTVSDEALNCFYDFAGDNGSIIAIKPDDNYELLKKLERVGVPLLPSDVGMAG